jgi:hypothetical protein
MFSDLCKNNKIYCCLEHLDCCLQQPGLSFLHPDIFGMILYGVTHLHVLCTKVPYFLFYLLFFEFVIGAGAYDLTSRKTLYTFGQNKKVYTTLDRLVYMFDKYDYESVSCQRLAHSPQSTVFVSLYLFLIKGIY